MCLPSCSRAGDRCRLVSHGCSEITLTAGSAHVNVPLVYHTKAWDLTYRSDAGIALLIQTYSDTNHDNALFTIFLQLYTSIVQILGWLRYKANSVHLCTLNDINSGGHPPEP